MAVGSQTLTESDVAVGGLFFFPDFDFEQKIHPGQRNFPTGFLKTMTFLLKKLMPQ